MPSHRSREAASRPLAGALAQPRETDRAISELARLQHGVVSRRQLLEMGLGRRAIAGRLERGNLHRVHLGVYAVGHPAISRQGMWMTGVLAGGDRAALSHRSAAALWGMLAADLRVVEVTAPQSTRSFGWLKRHRGCLAEDEVVREQGILVTTVSRTLLDLAAHVSAREFERALREAEFLRLPQRPPLAELLVRHAGRRGVGLARSTLERFSHLPGDTRSPLEDRFLRLAAKVGLPAPETNVTLRVDGRRFEADCLWRQARVILELDGHQAHGTRVAFEQDRERDRCLQAAGWTVVRATSSQVAEASSLVRHLRQLLAAREAA